jgi:WD40 repeat protein
LGIKALCGVQSSLQTLPKLQLGAQISRRASSPLLSEAIYILITPMAYRKIWDTFSGAALHSFPHNHIVRSVAFSPTASHLLTGGQEKKVRVFDLRRPDAEPDFLRGAGGTTAHEGTVKSVVWINEWNGVTAGEDGSVKYVPFLVDTSQVVNPIPVDGGIYAPACPLPP